MAAAKLVLFCGVVIFIGRALWRGFATVHWSEVRFRPQFLALAGACEVGMLLTAGWVYRLLLRPLYGPLRWPGMFAVAWVSRVGKYLPGKFASVLGAVWLLRGQDVPVPVGTGIVFLRQGMLLSMALVVAAPLTVWQPVYARLPMAWVWCASVVATGLVLLHPRVFFPVGNWLLDRLHLPGFHVRGGHGDYLRVLVLMGLSFVLAGLSVWCVARSITDLSLRWLPVCVSGAALAGALGFLAFFAPAGLGVREGILLVILGQFVEAGAAAISVTAARLLTIVVEIVMASVGLTILRSLRGKGVRR